MRIALAILLCALAMSLRASRGDIVEGNPASPVRVLIYEDLQCPDCRQFRALLDQKILPRYGTRVAFVHRDFPLGKHEWARAAAIAGRWISERNPQLGVTYRREIMAEQDHVTPSTLKPWLVEFARRNKLDEEGIVAALTDAKLAALVDQDYLGGVGRGISHAPTVYVGNQSLVETIMYEDLARLLDTELGR